MTAPSAAVPGQRPASAPPETVEIRVHGVHGTSPASMLGLDPSTSYVTACATTSAPDQTVDDLLAALNDRSWPAFPIPVPEIDAAHGRMISALPEGTKGGVLALMALDEEALTQLGAAGLGTAPPGGAIVLEFSISVG